MQFNYFVFQLLYNTGNQMSELHQRLVSTLAVAGFKQTAVTEAVDQR